MKLVVEQLDDLLTRLKLVEARLETLNVLEDEGQYLTQAELLLTKYNTEVLRIENIILQKKLLLSKLKIDAPIV